VNQSVTLVVQIKMAFTLIGGNMTSEELMLMVENDEEVIIDSWFPECRFSYRMNIPLTNREIIAKLPELKGTTMVTVNEIVIVMFLREIRLMRMQSEDFDLYCGGRKINLALNGEMLDSWDGGFFEDGFNLRFN